MLRIRKYLLVFSTICTGLCILQLFYVLHLQNVERRNTDMKYFMEYSSETTMVNELKEIDDEPDFTVNEILDHMQHSRNGDFITGNFSAILPPSVKNQAKLSFKSEKLKVIVVPHSHNDPGYKKTYLEYFNERTSKILTLAVEKMFQYHDMTFVWPETCFIQRWWSNQNKTTKTKFKYLVKSGRLELTSGGWVIPDEATPHYFAYLDQMIEGHYWIKRHLNIEPESSFDMDQFSLSSTVRHLMREAGIQNGVIKRVHLGMKQYFMQHKFMNFFWQVPSNSILRNDVFIQLEPYEWLSFPDSCGPSRSVCEDMDFGHDIQLPFPGTPEAEKPIRLLFHRHSSLGSFADKVVRQLKLKSSGYLHNVLLLPHGDDFRYDTANEWDRQYTNMKSLMKYINSNDKYSVQMEFGTLKDYFSEVKSRTEMHGIHYPRISGDFEPYARHLHYWSGFFTTRQYLKRLGRQLQESVRAADILMACVVLSGKHSDFLSNNMTSILHRLTSARRELDVFQHHDAITGTSFIQVVKDYETKLSSALSDTEKILGSLLQYIVNGNCKSCNRMEAEHTLQNDMNLKIVDERVFQPSFEYNLRNGTEAIGNLTGNTDVLFLYNSLTQPRVEVVSITLPNSSLTILDQAGVKIPFDYVSMFEKTQIFFNVKLPPLSISLLQLVKSRDTPSRRELKWKYFDRSENEIIFCENGAAILTFSSKDASPIEMCYKHEKFCVSLNIQWRQYIQTGGAYTLSSSNVSVNILQNDFTIRKISSERLCAVEVEHKYFKVEYIIQNTTGLAAKTLQLNVLTNLSRSHNKHFVGEFAMRLVTSIKNGHTFYSDTNGFYLARRKFRPKLPFSSNVYPMTSMAAIKDSTRTLTVHSAQPHGVVCLNPGVLDIMIDRVALLEEMGLNQKVTDNKPTLCKLFVQFEEVKRSDDFENLEMLVPTLNSVLLNDFLQHPLVKFKSTKPSTFTKDYTFLQNNIPLDIVIANMKVLTNEKLDIDGVSVTLHRRAMINIDSNLKRGTKAKSLSLHLQKIFKTGSNNKWKICKASLTHLKTKEELVNKELISFREMEMKTFLFHN